MNSNAHKHTLQFRRYRFGGTNYNSTNCDGRKAKGLTYGDQEMFWPSSIPILLETRRRRKIRRIIQRHDKSSIKEGIRIQTLDKKVEDYKKLINKYAEKEWSK